MHESADYSGRDCGKETEAQLGLQSFLLMKVDRGVGAAAGLLLGIQGKQWENPSRTSALVSSLAPNISSKFKREGRARF